MPLDRKAVLRQALKLPRSAAALKIEIPLVSWNLNALAVLHQTDKAPHLHNYTPYYRKHLRPLRRSARSVLEIGIGGFEGPRSGGASLRMWRDWFPSAQIYGIDIEPKDVSGDRILALQGDQSDADSLRAIARRYGPFDVIIDDGSHRNDHVVTSFDALYEFVRPGGYYVVEDIVTTYYEEMGGGPPGTQGTSMELVKQLCDCVQRGELRVERPVDMRQDRVGSISVYPNLVFIEKIDRERDGYKV